MAENDHFGEGEVGLDGGNAHADAAGDANEGEPEAARRSHRRSEELFRSGQARGSYKRTWNAADAGSSGDDESGDDGSGEDGGAADGGPAQRRTAKSCACRVVLESHRQRFEAMRVDGVTLKKRQRYEPTSETRRYRDLNQQNNWLLANVFDASGNYLYCMKCIQDVLGVNNKRLTRIRKQKREGCVQTCHKLQKKPSNRAKPATLQNFLEFVDNNRVPNGRRIGATSASFFFDPIFDSFRAPDKSDPHVEDKKRSVVAQFNAAQHLNGGERVCNSTAQAWLKKHRHDTAISPCKTDYCDRCKEYNEHIHRYQTIANRMHESGAAQPAQLAAKKQMANSYKQLLVEHKATAQSCVDEYKAVRDRCVQEYKEISDLEATGCNTPEAAQRLQELKDGFTAVLDADYQMSKLLPHWGYSAQPGTSYYKMKLAHEVMGVVFHGGPQHYLYVFHEGIGGAKTSDHTISCLDNVITQHLPAWVKHLVLVLDNAQINKNQYMTAYLSELVKRGRFSTARFMLMIPGHTKFSPDTLFARLAHSYIRADVFTTHDLVLIAARYGTAKELTGEELKCWMEDLVKVYKAVPAIKEVHDFVWWIDGAAEDRHHPKLKVRQLCYTGVYKEEEMVISPLEASADIYPRTYSQEGKCPGIGREKLAHLMEMYGRWIPPERRLEVLPPAPPVQPVPIAVPIPDGRSRPTWHANTRRRQRRRHAPFLAVMVPAIRM